MRIRPMLGDWEIPRVSSLHALEQRAWVELPIPGRVGSLFQDLNTRPTRMAVAGSLYGDETRDEFLEAVRERFRAGEPVTFVADILTATEVRYVVIDTLELEERGERPEETEYLLVIRESPPPPSPADPLGGLDAGLLEQAEGFMDTVTGALDVIDTLGSVPDIGDPTPQLRGALDGVAAATSGLDGIAADLRTLFHG